MLSKQSVFANIQAKDIIQYTEPLNFSYTYLIQNKDFKHIPDFAMSSLNCLKTKGTLCLFLKEIRCLQYLRDICKLDIKSTLFTYFRILLGRDKNQWGK